MEKTNKRKRYREEGRCITCGTKSDRYRCEKCRNKMANSIRLWRIKNPEYTREYQKKWRAMNPERDKLKQSTYRIKRKYGLTFEEYREILKSPCGICGKTGRVVLDHCHITNGIRGALCSPCNSQLGWYESNTQKIIDWVNRGRK